MNKWWKPYGRTRVECRRLWEEERAWLRRMRNKYGRMRATDENGETIRATGHICFRSDTELELTGIRFKEPPDSRDWTSRRGRSPLPEGFFFPKTKTKLPGLRAMLETVKLDKCNSDRLLQQLVLPPGTNPFAWVEYELVCRRLQLIELGGELYIQSGFDCRLRGCRRVSDITIERLFVRRIEGSQRGAKGPVKQKKKSDKVALSPVGRKKVASRRTATAKKSQDS